MTETENNIVSEEIHEKFEGSQMSKAGRLAMELAQEKKRLKAELDDLQIEVEELRPSTPTGTPDWYVKWIATILAVIGVFIVSANMYVLGMSAYLISAICWVYVGGVWNDRAIMIGSAITATSVALNLVERLLN